jgi:hypothetical protein
VLFYIAHSFQPTFFLLAIAIVANVFVIVVVVATLIKEKDVCKVILQ